MLPNDTIHHKISTLIDKDGKAPSCMSLITESDIKALNAIENKKKLKDLQKKLNKSVTDDDTHEVDQEL